MIVEDNFSNWGWFFPWLLIDWKINETTTGIRRYYLRYYWSNPNELGVVEFDDNNVVCIDEKHYWPYLYVLGKLL